MCVPELASIGTDLPYGMASMSRIVCRITREIMDEDNPPVVLPNGQVYSRKVCLVTATNLCLH